MTQTRWEDAWREGRTGWDAGAPAPALVELLASGLPGAPAAGQRALVPGCGAGWDVFALAEAGVIAQGAELAPTAAARFEALRAARGLDATAASIVIADFFTDALVGPYDMIWDYTFLCAIDPGLRGAWAAQMAALLPAGGMLWALVFPVDIQDSSASTSADPGPPFRLHPDVVRGLLGAAFEEVWCAPPAASHPGRAGREWLMGWRRR